MDQYVRTPFVPMMYVDVYMDAVYDEIKILIREFSVEGRKKTFQKIRFQSPERFQSGRSRVVAANCIRRQQRDYIIAASLSLGNIQTRSPYSNHFLHSPPES